MVFSSSVYTETFSPLLYIIQNRINEMDVTAVHE